MYVYYTQPDYIIPAVGIHSDEQQIFTKYTCARVMRKIIYNIVN